MKHKGWMRREGGEGTEDGRKGGEEI